jgi:hypothetical protein
MTPGKKIRTALMQAGPVHIKMLLLIRIRAAAGAVMLA